MLIDSKTKRRSARRLGVSAVELALIAPLLAVIIVGMLQMSKVMQIQVLLNNAARKGCEVAVQQGKSNADVIAEITGLMSSQGIGSTKFNPPSLGSVTTICTDPSGASVADALNAPSGSTITVTVTIPASSTMTFFSWFLSPTANQTETMVMQKI